MTRIGVQNLSDILRLGTTIHFRGGGWEVTKYIERVDQEPMITLVNTEPDKKTETVTLTPSEMARENEQWAIHQMRENRKLVFAETSDFHKVVQDNELEVQRILMVMASPQINMIQEAGILAQSLNALTLIANQYAGLLSSIQAVASNISEDITNIMPKKEG